MLARPLLSGDSDHGIGEAGTRATAAGSLPLN